MFDSRTANRTKAQRVSRRCKLIRAKQRRECQDVSDLGGGASDGVGGCVGARGRDYV